MKKNYRDARVALICLAALFLWIGCGGSKAGSDTTTTQENTEELQAEESESEDLAVNTSTYRAYTPSQMAETDWGDAEDDQDNEVAEIPKKQSSDKPADVLDDFSSCGDDPMCGGMLSMDDKKNKNKKKRKNRNKR